MSKSMEIISGGALGLLVGALVGLSVSSTVSSVVAGLVALLGSYLGLSDVTTSQANSNGKDRHPKLYRLTSFALVAVAALCIAIPVRSSGFLSPKPSKLFEGWRSIGLDSISASAMVIYQKTGLVPNQMVQGSGAEEALRAGLGGAYTGGSGEAGSCFDVDSPHDYRSSDEAVVAYTDAFPDLAYLLEIISTAEPQLEERFLDAVYRNRCP